MNKIRIEICVKNIIIENENDKLNNKQKHYMILYRIIL